MKENKRNHHIKNNCLSSNFFNYNDLNTLPKRNAKSSIENDEKASNSNPSKINSKSQNHIKSSLSLFMQKQNQKHLTTNFSHKDVDKFLKEKDKAMEEIILEEDNISNNQNKNDINTNEDENKNQVFSRQVKFHGTFGKDEYQKNRKNVHHHHHHHHPHHHHHHHFSSQDILDKNNGQQKDKNQQIILKC